MSYISWSIEFALYHFRKFKWFFIIKKWRRSWVVVPLRALALVFVIINTVPVTPISPWSDHVAEQLALPTSDHGVAGLNPAGGEILPNLNGASLKRAFHVHPSIVSKCLKYCWKGHKTWLIHPSNKLHVKRILACKQILWFFQQMWLFSIKLVSAFFFLSDTDYRLFLILCQIVTNLCLETHDSGSIQYLRLDCV